MAKEPAADLGLTGEGVERKKIAALDTAYRTYKPHRSKFSEASKAHVEQKKKLMAKIHEHADQLPKDEAGNAFYVTSDDMRLTLETAEKLSIDVEESEE
jgi:hypothetical protein